MLLFSCIHLSSPTTGVAGTRGGDLSLLTGPFAVSFFQLVRVVRSPLLLEQTRSRAVITYSARSPSHHSVSSITHTHKFSVLFSLPVLSIIFFLFPLYHIRNIPSTNQQQLGSSQPSKPINTSRQMSLSLSILAPVPPCLFVPVSISLLEYVCNHPIKVNASQKRTKPTFLQLPPAWDISEE